MAAIVGPNDASGAMERRRREIPTSFTCRKMLVQSNHNAIAPQLLQPMRAAVSVLQVTGPSAVCMAAPLKLATRSPLVRSIGCTPSHTFFFCSGFGSMGLACSDTPIAQQTPAAISSAWLGLSQTQRVATITCQRQLGGLLQIKTASVVKFTSN